MEFRIFKDALKNLTARSNKWKKSAELAERDIFGGLVTPRSYQAAIPLQREHVQNCKLLENRKAHLEYLPKKAVCAEIGILHGDFSVDIVEITDPIEFHLIDMRQVCLDEAKTKLSGRTNGIKVVYHEGYSWDMLKGFVDETFDWLYIDADHTYASAKLDAEVAIRKIKKDGLLVFNDYSFFDHIRDYKMGVVEVVNELWVHHGFEMIYFALHEQMYCDVVLKRR